MKRNVNVTNWLKGNCCFKGCIHNDGFGSCLTEDNNFVDEMLDVLHESYKDNKDIPKDKVFDCINFEIEDGLCEYCGSETLIHKEYPDGGKQFLPVTYMVCRNKQCRGCE